MKCPHCNRSNKHGVYRTYPALNLILRERVCDECDRKFYTKEEVYQKLTKQNDQAPLEFDKTNKKPPQK